MACGCDVATGVTTYMAALRMMTRSSHTTAILVIVDVIQIVDEVQFMHQISVSVVLFVRFVLGSRTLPSSPCGKAQPVAMPTPCSSFAHRRSWLFCQQNTVHLLRQQCQRHHLHQGDNRSQVRSG